MPRTVTERMDEALAYLRSRYGGKRQPKAFYLGPDDWADFLATNPPLARFSRGNNPIVWADEPSYHELPVRESKNVPPRQSRLYDQRAAGRFLPR